MWLNSKLNLLIAPVVGEEPNPKMVGNTGVEPVTSSMSRKRSNQLS